jgi:hypothetical protein
MKNSMRNEEHRLPRWLTKTARVMIGVYVLLPPAFVVFHVTGNTNLSGPMAAGVVLLGMMLPAPWFILSVLCKISDDVAVMRRVENTKGSENISLFKTMHD